MLIKDSNKFLHSFFFSADEYSADAIDKAVDSSIVQCCINAKMIREKCDRHGRRLYVILEDGKRVVGK